MTEKFTRHETAIPPVCIIEPRVFGDARGFFLESFHGEWMDRLGIHGPFVQDNHSRSAKGVLRGLHYQSRFPQGKLIRVIRGSIFDLAVDIRKGSPTYGQSVHAILSAENFRMIWVPIGFAHGFLALEDVTEVLYKTTDYYHPEWDAGIRWDDPALHIPWPLAEHGIKTPLVSEKDRVLPVLDAIDSPFVYKPE